MKKKVFSGIRPSGKLHIGNYLGAVKNWLKLQNDYNCIYGIADYHAITTPFNPKTMQKNIRDVVLDYLACGLDPKKSSIIIQSKVPEHTELSWILGTITPVAMLKRMPTYKEKKQMHPQYVNAGLLTYPILMAADILIYKANLVPIGEDQLPHLELNAYLAKKFNKKFGNTFPIPKPLLSKESRIMSLDGRGKMSKSFGEKSYIALSDSPDAIREKIAGAVTDTKRIKRENPGSLERCNLKDILKAFTPKECLEKIKKQCQKAEIGCVECKKMLAERIIKELEPIRKKRAILEKKPAYIKKVLEEGVRKAKKIAQETLKEVKNKIGLV